MSKNTNRTKAYVVGFVNILMGVIMSFYGIAWKFGHPPPPSFLEHCESPFMAILGGVIFVGCGVFLLLIAKDDSARNVR